MTEASPTLVLISELDKGGSVLGRIAGFYEEILSTDRPFQNRSTRNAILLADALTSYYTCAETQFLRISRHFENALAPEKWHRDLLHKMSLEIPGVRARVIREETRSRLEELLRFRHFKRYYFEFEYDWTRLEYLDQQFSGIRQLLPADLAVFRGFLERLIADAGNQERGLQPAGPSAAGRGADARERSEGGSDVPAA